MEKVTTWSHVSVCGGSARIFLCNFFLGTLLGNNIVHRFASSHDQSLFQLDGAKIMVTGEVEYAPVSKHYDLGSKEVLFHSCFHGPVHVTSEKKRWTQWFLVTSKLGLCFTILVQGCNCKYYFLYYISTDLRRLKCNAKYWPVLEIPTFNRNREWTARKQCKTYLKFS